MADFERCFCGAQSITQQGNCAKHADRERPVHVERTLEQRLATAEHNASFFEGEFRRFKERFVRADLRATEFNKILMLLAMGDVKVEQIDSIVKDINTRLPRLT
jgi:hypothetical protein